MTDLPSPRRADGDPNDDAPADAGNAKTEPLALPVQSYPRESGRLSTAAPPGTPPGTPEQPRVAVGPDLRWTWPTINLGGIVVVAVVAWIANLIPFNGSTTTEVIDRHPVPYQPATWAYGAWALMFLLLVVFVVYGLLPAGRRNKRVSVASPLLLVMNAALIVWLVLWHWDVFIGALGAMIVSLVAVLMIYFAVRVHRRSNTGPSKLQRLITWTPFSLATAWLMNVTLITLMVWWRTSGWDGGPFSLSVWGMLLIIGGVAISALFGLGFRDPVVPLVFAWTFIGIASLQGGDRLGVTIMAVIGAVFGAGLAVMATLLEFDEHAMHRLTPRRTVTQTSPQSGEQTSTLDDRERRP